MVGFVLVNAIFIFLRYPSDADKHLLARQTGLSRNQVSNWFINARVRLWKPMVEEMYQLEGKPVEDGSEDTENKNQNSALNAQNPMPSMTPSTSPPPLSATSLAATTTITGTGTSEPAAIRRPDMAATRTDPSLIREVFSGNQAKQPTSTTAGAREAVQSAAAMTRCFPAAQEYAELQEMWRQGSMVTGDYGTISGEQAAELNGATLIRFGSSNTTSGDVSLTLGLRHAGNIPEKTSFSVRDFGGS